MMGYQEPSQENLFLYGIILEHRVWKDYPLRKIKDVIDFDLIYKTVKKKYGTNGNVSIPPPIILKLVLLLIPYNVLPERELMETLPERLDWVWFLGYTLETAIPDQSVLSGARKRWGHDAFKEFFDRIVVQCAENGLVDGTKIFANSSLIDADMSKNSVVDTHSLQRYLKEGYRELEGRLDEHDGQGSHSDVNQRYRSTTDPDASIVSHGTKPDLFYKTHRAVDLLCEIGTAVVEVTPGAINEAHRMVPLLEAHTENTDRTVETVVVDSMYGTIENYLILNTRGIAAHMPLLKTHQINTGRKAGIFPEEAFTHDTVSDAMVCPAGKTLTKRTFHEHRHSTEYRAAKRDCMN